MKIRTWAAILAAAAIALSAAPAIYGQTETSQAGSADKAAAGAPAPSADGQTVRVAENGRLALEFNPLTAEVAVTDLASNAVWRSNPEGREKDPVAKGMKKMNLNAQLLLDYVDAQNKPFQLNSFTGSVRGKTFTWKRVEGGVEVTFAFPQGGFTVPVRYTLQDDAFSAEIVTSGIKQGGKYSLISIDLLPFFGAGGTGDEGYMLVPDGSGALIRFNNGKAGYKSYNERVYGGDQALDVPERPNVTETVRLPVFGEKNGDRAFLAVIAQGAYQAGITAEVSGKSNAYNAVSSYLSLMEFETNTLMEGTPSEKQVVRGSKSLTGGVPYEVKYYFLNGGQADYSGMAARYRDYLQREQGVKPLAAGADGQIPLLVDFLGGVKKKDTFLGIPYNTVETLTSYDDVRAAANRMAGDGIGNLAIRYEGWESGGMKDKVPTSLDGDRRLGGDKELKELTGDLQAKGVKFYPAVDPVRFYKGGNGFNKFFDVAKTISRAPALKYDYRLSDGTRNKDMTRWYLLKPESVKEAVGRFAGSARKSGLLRASLQSIGSDVYSDFRRSTLPKNETGRIWETSLREAKTQLGLMLDHANAYAFPDAESVTDVPLYSSGFDVEDEEVPFYSMAVSGLLPAYGEPVNLSSEPKRYVLKLIETGTYPAYRFVARDGSLLAGTEFDSLYSGDFNGWYGDMLQQYRTVNDALRPVMGRAIAKHERLGDGIARTTFAGGIAILVNYNDKPVTIGKSRVGAESYAIEREVSG